jgi:hypothetical protein
LRSSRSPSRAIKRQSATGSSVLLRRCRPAIPLGSSYL